MSRPGVAARAEQLHATLKPGGVLFSSNPRGQNEENWHSGRYGAYHDLPAWRAYLTAAGFVELEHYYRPAGLVREEQPWLCSGVASLSALVLPGRGPAMLARARAAFDGRILTTTTELRENPREDQFIVLLLAGRRGRLLPRHQAAVARLRAQRTESLQGHLNRGDRGAV